MSVVGGLSIKNLEEVTFCGLYCGLCASHRRIPQQAAVLREILRQEGYDRGYIDTPGLERVFNEFWKGLNCLADQPCPGCHAGGGNPDCAIRSCAQERGVIACPLCVDYPCKRLDALEGYPLHAADGRRMQVIGIEQWVAEQEARVARGFAYADVRLPEETRESHDPHGLVLLGTTNISSWQFHLLLQRPGQKLFDII